MAYQAADWLATQAIKGLVAGAGTLPHARRVPLMGALMRRGLGPLTGFHRRARNNLERVWPESGKETRHRIADEVLDNFGRTFIENENPDLGRHLADLAPEGAGLDALDDARRTGRPILFVNAHFGNHEVPRHVLTRMGMTIGGLYRPFKNPSFDAHYRKGLARLGGTVFEQGRRGTIGLIRYLRDGGHGILFYDVNYDAGVPIPFMGLPAMTATSAAEIALKVDALVLPNFGIRQPDGLTFRAVIEAPIPLTDPVTMTTEMTRRLEARVKADPGQWFWVHNRWKDRRGVIAAAAAAADDDNNTQKTGG